MEKIEINGKRDLSVARSVTLPAILDGLLIKYGISRSDAMREGALMLLRMNDGFMDSDDDLERAYRAARSKYRDKLELLTKAISKLSGVEVVEKTADSERSPYID